jgi:hypothetical protein
VLRALAAKSRLPNSVRTECHDVAPHGAAFAHQWRAAEPALGLQRVVRAAAELKILDARLSACRVRNDVVKFEKSRFLATPLAAVKGTSAAIPVRDRTLDGGGNVSRGNRAQRARIVVSGAPTWNGSTSAR